MKLSDFRKLKPGDLIILTEDVEGRYSGYGPRAKFTAKFGECLTVKSANVPTVIENRRGNCFAVCLHPHWDEGVSVHHWQVKPFTIPEDWECPGCGEHECPGCSGPNGTQTLSCFI